MSKDETWEKINIPKKTLWRIYLKEVKPYNKQVIASRYVKKDLFKIVEELRTEQVLIENLEKVIKKKITEGSLVVDALETKIITKGIITVMYCLLIQENRAQKQTPVVAIDDAEYKGTEVITIIKFKINTRRRYIGKIKNMETKKNQFENLKKKHNINQIICKRIESKWWREKKFQIMESMLKDINFSDVKHIFCCNLNLQRDDLLVEFLSKYIEKNKIYIGYTHGKNREKGKTELERQVNKWVDVAGNIGRAILIEKPELILE